MTWVFTIRKKKVEEKGRGTLSDGKMSVGSPKHRTLCAVDHKQAWLLKTEKLVQNVLGCGQLDR